MRGFLAAACAGLPLVIATACSGATIEPVQGDLLINRGQGFQQVNGRIEADMGDLVMVSPHASASLSYPDGCKVNVQPGAVTTIGPLSPCASGSRAQHPLPAQAATRLPNGVVIIDPTITIKGTTTSSARASQYQRGGETLTSTNQQVNREGGHAADYDGETVITAEYNIVKLPNGGLDSESTITFTTVTYTNRGTVVKSGFKTLPIPINSVSYNADGSVASISFGGNEWYPPTANGAGSINDKGLAGKIDLNTGKVEITSAYQIKSNGVVDTYSFNGTIEPPKKPAPGRPVANNPVAPPETPVPPTNPLLGAAVIGGDLTVFGTIIYEATRVRPASP